MNNSAPHCLFEKTDFLLSGIGKIRDVMTRPGQHAGLAAESLNTSGKACPGSIFLFLLFLFSVLSGSAINAAAAEKTFPITVNYSGTLGLQTITVDFCDDWLLQPDDQYNHKLAQAAFAMAVSCFRSEVYDIPEKDHDILDFFDKAGFVEPASYDYDKKPGSDTIADVIAHKKTGDDTLIAVSISGNHYQNEWLSNFSIDNNERHTGFDNAAKMVMGRIEDYIRTHHLTGDLHLLVTGFSRAAAVANIMAADAVESRKFQTVHAYTFATPRTTREDDPDRYHNIFNIIDPEDIVPLVPFSEWGYERYGTDLFLPSISTDSFYNTKYIDAMDAGFFVDESDLPILNPRIIRVLHTIFDYIAFFVNSPETYMYNIQEILINFYENRNITDLVKRSGEKIHFSDILNSFRKQRAKFLFNLNEYYNFFDFITQYAINAFLAAKLDQSWDYYWNRNISVIENVGFGHLEKTYRSWLFSSDDPAKIFMKDPKYFHLTIRGDVDVEIYDDHGDLVEIIDNRGEFSYDTELARWPDFRGDMDNFLIYADRQGNQTLLVIPADRVYMLYIYSNKDQTIRVANVEYNTEGLMADFKYCYYDHYDKGEGYLEVIDPLRERLTAAEAPEEFADVQLIDPWPEDISYSPTAIMRLETGGIFLPKPLVLMIALNLILNEIFGLVILFIIKVIQTLIIGFRRKVLGIDILAKKDTLELPEAKKQAAGSL